jgi:hypothetical protein
LPPLSGTILLRLRSKNTTLLGRISRNCREQKAGCTRAVLFSNGKLRGTAKFNGASYLEYFEEWLFVQ